MRLIAALALVFALVGCGGPRAQHSVNYPLKDRDATMNAFMESVKEYYEKRGGGKLSDPAVTPDSIRYMFKYEKIAGGKYAEEIRLDLHKLRNTRQNDGTMKDEPAHYNVGVWYPVEGSDPEALEPQAAIVAGMKKRLGETTGNP